MNVFKQGNFVLDILYLITYGGQNVRDNGADMHQLVVWIIN